MNKKADAKPAPVECVVMPYEDRNHKWNGDAYRTGKPCVEGCGRPAGTAWSPYWCVDCNIERMRRISRNLRAIVG